MNSKASFESLYRKYQPSLVSYACYIVQSNRDAKELVNDVFVSVWNKRVDLPMDDSLKSYLFKAVKHRCLNHQRKKNLDTLPDNHVQRVSSYKADHFILEKEHAQFIAHTMNSLPPKCKQVFSMSRIDQLSNAEISDLLNISIKTVEAQITKAIKIFRKKWPKE